MQEIFYFYEHISFSHFFTSAHVSVHYKKRVDFCKIMRYKMVYIMQFKVGKNSKADFLGINLLTN